MLLISCLMILHFEQKRIFDHQKSARFNLKANICNF